MYPPNFPPQKPLRFLFIGRIAENRRDLQLLCRIGLHLFLELFIVELRHRYTGHRKEGIKTRQTLLLLDFLDWFFPDATSLIFVSA